MKELQTISAHIRIVYVNTNWTSPVSQVPSGRPHIEHLSQIEKRGTK